MKVQIELNLSKQLLEEFEETNGDLKEAVVGFVKKSIQSGRRRKEMEKVREIQEKARKRADEVDDLEIS